MSIPFDPNRRTQHTSHAQEAGKVTKGAFKDGASKVDDLILARFPPIHRHDCTAFDDYGEKMYSGGRNVNAEAAGHEGGQVSALFDRKAVGG